MRPRIDHAYGFFGPAPPGRPSLHPDTAYTPETYTAAPIPRAASSPTFPLVRAGPSRRVLRRDFCGVAFLFSPMTGAALPRLEAPLKAEYVETLMQRSPFTKPPVKRGPAHLHARKLRSTLALHYTRGQTLRRRFPGFLRSRGSSLHLRAHRTRRRSAQVNRRPLQCASICAALTFDRQWNRPTQIHCQHAVQKLIHRFQQLSSRQISAETRAPAVVTLRLI